MQNSATNNLIFVFEDDPDISALVESTLSMSGYAVISTPTFAEFEELHQSVTPAAFVVDLCLPMVSGDRICRELRSREQFKDTPIIVYSSSSTEEEMEMALEAGADDYLEKRFTPKLLLLKIKALLRRSAQSEDTEAQELQSEAVVEGLSFNSSRFTVELRDTSLPFTHFEFKVLYLLAVNAGNALSREEIIDYVHGKGISVGPRVVDVFVRRIREKLALSAHGPEIKSVRGVGYQLVTKP